MKKFTIPCDFGGQKAPFDVYIGRPKMGNHPLQNQASWLSSERGGNIPPDVMESFAKLLALADENGVSFEDLCVYALEEAQKKGEGFASSSDSSPPPESAPVPQNGQEVQYNPVELQMAEPQASDQDDDEQPNPIIEP